MINVIQELGFTFNCVYKKADHDIQVGTLTCPNVKQPATALSQHA